MNDINEQKISSMLIQKFESKKILLENKIEKLQIELNQIISTILTLQKEITLQNILSCKDLSIIEATLQHFKDNPIPLNKDDLAQALIDGGIQTKSHNFANTLEATLYKHVKNTGINRENGKWNLKEKT